MLSIFQRYLSLGLISILALFVNHSLLAQTYEISFDGGSNWTDISTLGSPISVCPNTEYLIGINASAATNDVYIEGAGQTQLSVQGGVNFATVSNLCASHTTGGATTTTIAYVKFGYSATPSDIDIYDKNPSNCNGTGTGTNISFQTLEVAATFTNATPSVCEGSTNVSITANGVTGATYQWYDGSGATSSSISGATSLTYNIPDSKFTGPGSFDLTLQSSLTSGSLSCSDETIVTYTINPKPSGLSATYNTGVRTVANSNASLSTTYSEICVNGTQGLTGAATNNPPSSTGGYTWIIRYTTENGTADNGTSIRRFGGGVADNDFVIDPSNLSLEHGTYDVLLEVENDFGCVSNLQEINTSAADLVINDRPGVKIYHNIGDPTWTDQTSTNHSGSNTVEICTGERLQLSAYPCNATDYTATDYNNNDTDPNAPNITSGGTQPYTSPCNGTLFASEVWNMKIDGQPNTDRYDFDVVNAANNQYSAVPDNLGSAGYVENISVTPTTTLDYVEISTMEPAQYIYTLTATGQNGCSRNDNIKVLISQPTITFELNGDGTILAEGVTELKCEGSTNTVTAYCDLCEPGFDTDWDNNTYLYNSGALVGSYTGPNSISGATDVNPVTTNALTVGTATATDGSTHTETAYRVEIEDSRGCVSRTLAANGEPADNIWIDVGGAPDMTAAIYKGNLCDGAPMELTLTGTGLSGFDYEVYRGTPGSGSLVYSCASGTCNLTGSDLVLSAITGQAAYAPVDNQEYYIVAKPSGGGASCTTPDIVIDDGTGDTRADVGQSPDARPATTSLFNSVNNKTYCNASGGKIYLDYNADPNWQYQWGIASSTVGGIHTTPDLTSSSLTGFTNGGASTSGGIFGTIFGFIRIVFGSSPSVGAEFPPSRDYSSIEFVVTVTDGNCKQVVTFDPMVIEDCQDPVLYAESFNSAGSGTGNIPVTATTPFQYVCEGGYIDYEVQGGSGYTYLWNTGETTASIEVYTNASTPDTVTSSVFVMDGADTIEYIQHTFVVSRGNVNFYPQGDDGSTIDTSICENEALYAQANCPTCYGTLIYEWDYLSTTPATPVTTGDGSVTQLHVQYPPNPLPRPNSFDVNLRLSHGEGATCQLEIVRQIDINPLPTVGITFNGEPVSSPNPIPLYRCVDTTNELSVNCSGCTSSLVAWNTGATTPTINVPAQGGYYALLTDQNSCRQISEIAVVVDAMDGYNAPVSASPSEICSGNPAVLQVPPCVGCAYTWYQQQIPLDSIGNTRIQNITNPGVYFAEVLNAQNCTYNTQNFTVTANAMAPPIIRGSTDTVCANQRATLWTRDGTGFSFQWYYQSPSASNLSPITGATDSSYVTLPGAVGTYQVRVTYANGCVEESPLYVLDSTSFTPTITASGTEICTDETVTVSTPLSPGWQYQWYRNGIAMTGETGSVLYADSAGSYYALVTNYNGCAAQTIAADLTKTELLKPVATTSTPTICPGEFGRLSVSLCVDCQYEWFDVTPTSIAAQSATGFNYNGVTNTGDYYAVVYKGSCSERSDTVSIVRNAVFTPSINNLSSVVCNGRDGILTTQTCTGCSYRWLLDGSPALGALNDTFHIISDISKIGDYQVAIDDANGCSDTSGILTVVDGSFDLTIATDSGTIICNGAGERITATVDYGAGTAPAGAYNYTLFLNNTPVTGSSNINSSLLSYPFTGNDDPGAYTVEVVDPNGCTELSNFIFLDTINVVPTITSRATSDPNSVAATAICDSNGTVYLEVDVANCAGCNYQWFEGGNSMSGETGTTLLTPAGPAGAGIYTINVENQGCQATSNAISIIDATAGFNNTISPDTASICDGQSATLSYTGATCTNCSYRWLRAVDGISDGNPIGGANSSQYVATVDGWYTLEVTTPLGCVDTSNVSVVRSITRPIGLTLDLDSVTLVLNAAPNTGSATPIAASASAINLNSWVFPDSARNGGGWADSSKFTNSPYNAALNCGGASICNPGLSGADSSLFTPADSLVGNHLITYYYYEAGCEFSVQDVLRVLPAATITITNSNPSAVAYEACIGDDLVISAQNLKFRVEEIYAFDSSGAYILMNPTSFVYDTITYGSDTFYNSTINWTVPTNAYASYLMLMNNTAPPALDTIESPYLLIHNTDLSFAGLPGTGELCSNGSALTLYGNPTGGTFSVTDTNGTTIAGATVGDTLYPTLLYNTLSSSVDNMQPVNVLYSYTQTYTNGNPCPNLDEVTQRITAVDVRLTDVAFNNIAVSQDEELLTNLVYSVAPYNARANKQDNYTVGFSGSFTSPAGAPEIFLPSNAGVGRHALTYKITQGSCTNSIEDSIDVVAAPSDIAMPDTICRNFGTVAFGRHTDFPYALSMPPPPNSVVTFTDSVHVLRVSGQGVIPNNTFLGAETFTYDPTAVTGNYDTLVIEYVFYRDEDTLGVDFDTLEYVVASVIKPIYIEDLITVDINDTVVQSFYCQDSALSILTASPPDTFGRGVFMLFGGTGQYQFGDTLHNSVINPYDVNNSENATTTYDLVYILNGVACENSDTLPITIAKGLNPMFTAATGVDEFCDTDPAIAISHNVTSPDTAIWKIGGIPQASYVFDPGPLNPGIHVLELQQIYTYVQGTDTFTCSAAATDTFTIHALPNITVSPSLDQQYCNNDTIVDFIVSPSPDCPQYGGSGHYVLDENFDAGVPASWVVNTIAGKPWAPDVFNPQGGVGQATFVDTSYIVNNSWLISPPMDMTAGHTYRLSYMVLTGEADPNCGSGCVASLFVGLGNSTSTTSIATTLDYQPLLDNDQAYVRYTVDYFHDPSAGAVTGQYYMGFRNFSPALGRALYLDNVEMRDLTIDSCQQGGIGYVDGPGAYNVSDSLYQFDPLSVPAGNIEVKYVYTNTYGCQDSVVFPIQVDTAPVVSFTSMDSSYCENEPDLTLTGNPLGGTFTSSQGTNLYDDTTYATLSPAFFPVAYQLNTAGTDIISYTYTDGNGCSETAKDTVVIVPLLDFNAISGIDQLGYGYCIVDSANILDVTNVPPVGSGSYISNGTFYGAGVRNGAAGAGVATFHTDSAVIDMGHTGDVTLSYVFTTTTGCLDTSYQVVRVHANPDLSFVNLPDSLCLNADSFRVIVQNRVITGSTGQTIYYDTLGRQVGTFTETDVFGNAVPNFIQLFDTLYPYEANGYSQINVSYLYRTDTALGACESTLYDSVRIDSVPVAYFQNLQDYYCENEPPSTFLAFPSFYVGSGYLQIDTTQYGRAYFTIDPSVMVGAGQTIATYPTYYTFTDSRGCTGEVYDTFEVRPYPRITFDPAAQDTFCYQAGQRYDLRQMIVSPAGGYFTDNLALTSIRDSFYLDLGSQVGPRLVTYNYIDTSTLCENSDSIWIYLFSAPELDFDIFGGCSQMDITFSGTANNLVAGVDSITQIWWDFEGNGNLTYTQLDTSPITIPDTTYQYSSPGTYNVTLYVSNQGSCTQQVTKALIVSPYYNLANGDYFEDFNTGAGDWYDDQPTGLTPSNIWTYEPTVTGSQIVTGDGAWVTTADSLYMPGQSAWVYSPCFDFTSSTRPMIAFDLWRDVLSGIDGAILEYYDNTNNTWERVGDVGEGINWYQSDFVLARPGNQATVNFPRGWTGRSGGYESARLRLDQFEGQRDIRFRIAFAVSPQTVIDSLSGSGYEGIAFDNVWIGERTRNVLVEHFSNINYQTVGGLTSDDIDNAVYNKIFNSDYGTDVVLLQYQIDDNSNSGDPIYSSNPADLGGRGFDYNRQPGEILIDGRQIGTGLSENLDEWEMDYDMLQFPSFDVSIDQPITVVGNVLTSSATVEALEDMPDEDYIIHMAIIQDSLTYNSRSFEMLNIVRKMEPDNTGTNENHAWTTGQTASIAHSWDYSSQLGVASFNPDQLEVVVFVQNDNTNEVYQVATTQDMNRYNGVQTIGTDPRTEIFDLNVYPNPSSDLFNVAFDEALTQAYNWRLVDVTGRTLQMGVAEQGTQQFTINAERLVDGAYFFVIQSEDNQVYAQRKLIVIKR